MAKKYLFSESKDNLLTYILLFIPITFIYNVLHELGHGIFALTLGYDIEKFVIPIFTDFINGSARIWLIIPENAPLSNLILISLGGSLFNLLIGSVLLFLAYKLKFSRTIETILGLYGFILSMDFIIYNIGDVFFIQEGDWMYVFSHFPYINGIFIIIAILYLIILVRQKKEIVKEIQFIDG